MKPETHLKGSTYQYDYENPYVPVKMFLTFPQSEDEYFVGKDKSMRRFLFEGTACNTYTPFELQKEASFDKYWEENKQKIPEIVRTSNFWTRDWKLRWLTSEAFDNKNTIKAMEAHTRYLQTNRFDVNAKCEHFLKQGIFYVSGRDAYLRPILVFDIDKMLSVKMESEDLIECQKYFFEKVLNEYLLPGQVETWVAIIDVGFRNLASLFGPMRASISYLSNTFRNRMNICYVVRIPTSLSFLWAVIKKVLHEDTEKKINFLDKQEVGPLLEYANPSQLEKKYGGTQEEIKEFWPPRTVETLEKLNLLDFKHPKIIKDEISIDQYNSKYTRSDLQGHRVCQKLIKQKESESAKELEKQEEKISNKIISREEKWSTMELPREYCPKQGKLVGSIEWSKLI